MNEGRKDTGEVGLFSVKTVVVGRMYIPRAGPPIYAMYTVL